MADFLVKPEDVLGLDALDLKKVARISLAESALAAPHAGSGDVDFYPDMAQRAAILCSRLIRNHPLPDGNKRVPFFACSTNSSATA